MATKYIGDLTSVSTLNSGDELVINQASDQGTKKITFSDFKDNLPFEDAPTVLTGTLAAAATSLTFSDASITTSSLLDIYTDTWGISPTAVTVTTGQAVLTFEAQGSSVSVKLLVR